MIEFIAATYNEEDQIDGLIEHVGDYVDRINIVDDVSTDSTPEILDKWWHRLNQASHDWDIFTWHQMETHTGLPETVKAAALQVCDPDSWVLMLDCDERFAPGVLDQIKDFVNSPESQDITHVWFTLVEYIDNVQTKVFQKCRLFKAHAAGFSNSVHEDDTFIGQGAFYNWIVIHQKSANKQIRRELEYLETYRKLLDEGKITQDRFNTLVSYHYFVKVPHG